MVFSGTVLDTLNSGSNNTIDENYEIYFGDTAANTELFTQANLNLITDRAGNVLDLNGFTNATPAGAGVKLLNAK